MPPPTPGATGIDALAAGVAARLGDLPNVVAVVLGGSRAAGVAAPGSDLDLYVYADPAPPVSLRAALVGPADRRELDQHFWEPGDAWVDGETGVQVDVMYRAPGWIEGELARVLDRHEASVGYSTALWHNVWVSRPLVDHDGWFAVLQERARVPYPEPLRRAVVAKNHPILRRSLFSFLRQIEDALARDDSVAVQHRLTALLASFFDVLFALNRQTHPGEKRLLRYAEDACPRRPADLGARVDSLLATAAPPSRSNELLRLANGLVDDLDDQLLAADLLPADPPGSRPSRL